MDDTVSINAKIHDTLEIMPGVVIRMLEIEGDPRLQMVLVVDENTNFDAINKNRKVIKSFLQGLDQVQGSNLNEDYARELFGLYRWHKEGISWKNMMLLLNYLALALAIMAFEESNVPEEKLPRLGTNQKHLTDSRFMSGFGGISLTFTFLALGMAIVDFDRWMKHMFDVMEGNQTLFGITNEPFDKERIRDKVRYFLDNVKSGKIILSEEESQWNILETKIYTANHRGFFIKANALLDTADTKDWNRNKRILQRKVLEICNRWDTTNDAKINVFRDMIRNSGKN